MIGTITLGGLRMDISDLRLSNGAFNIEANTVIKNINDVPVGETDILVIYGRDGNAVTCGVCPVPAELKIVRHGDKVCFSQEVKVSSMTFEERK